MQKIFLLMKARMPRLRRMDVLTDVDFFENLYFILFLISIFVILSIY